jgi:sugar fermentation stimulation protein A
MLGAITIDGPRELECKTAQDLGEIFELVIPGFGASDCRCNGHLFYAKELLENI